MIGGEGSALASLLAFELCLWVVNKGEVASPSMISRRSAKQASLGFVETGKKLKGRSSIAATLMVDRPAAVAGHGGVLVCARDGVRNDGLADGWLEFICIS